MRIRLRGALARALPLLFAAALTACGGGGGGASDTSGGGAVQQPPPPAPITKVEAYRFLNQATFGATEADAQQVISQRYSAWIDAQMDVARTPVSLQLPIVRQAYDAFVASGQPLTNIGMFNTDRVDAWFRNSLRGPDQLRQRVAWALSQIMVVSQNGALVNSPLGLADYYDMLARNAFGNFRQLMEDVTLHPSMGVYLSMLGNRRENAALNIRPDENYARELMQLFTIGLVQLNADGTVRLENGQPIPTYGQNEVQGFSRVFTGWNYACPAARPTCTFANTARSIDNQIVPMRVYPDQHEVNLTKQLLSYPGAAITVLPAGQTPEQNLRQALDNIFNHPNVGPFISKQLIQKLVTSNPSPAYVGRIAAVFNDNGRGTRGDLGAVVRAILLDTEARSAPSAASSGKMKEPLLRITQLWRAYDGRAQSGRYLPAQVGGPSATFAQGPLQSPSVFNFFSPFFAPPGEISTQNLVAPELQLSTEFQNTVITNFIYNQAFFRQASPSVTNADWIVLDVREEAAVFDNAESLVTRVAERLLGGQISATLRSEVVAQINRTAPTATNAATTRVAEAIFLVASSPEFALQR